MRNIQEISNKLVSRYFKKSNAQYAERTKDFGKARVTGDSETYDKIHKYMRKRDRGLALMDKRRARQKASKVNENWESKVHHKSDKNEVREMEWTGEGRDKGKKVYQVDHYTGKGRGWHTTQHRSLNGAKKAAGIKEENIQELSPRVVGSYIKQAAISSAHELGVRKNPGKAFRRQKFISKASDRLVKAAGDTPSRYTGERRKSVNESLLNKRTPTPEEISQKSGVSLAQIKSALKHGMNVEKEHTTKTSVAREIALDHLGERPDYYKRLAKVEEGYVNIKYPDGTTKSFGGAGPRRKSYQDLKTKYTGPVRSTASKAIDHAKERLDKVNWKGVVKKADDKQQADLRNKEQ